MAARNACHVKTTKAIDDGELTPESGWLDRGSRGLCRRNRQCRDLVGRALVLHRPTAQTQRMGETRCGCSCPSCASSNSECSATTSCVACEEGATRKRAVAERSAIH